jgi:acyl-CoA synthetase (AMP-forming)/AMP-acid ligase II/3-oxoacyl-(acyl-carrier-protein) synthase/acyl carrier protein
MADNAAQNSTIDPLWFLQVCQQFPKSDLFTLEYSTAGLTSLTGATLLQGIESTAHLLRKNSQSQQRVLLLLPHGLEYIQSLLACLHANLVAVPVALVELLQESLSAIAISSLFRAAQIELVLTNKMGAQILQTMPQITGVPILRIEDAVSKITSESLIERPAPEDVALLLFTSGSTSQPKGIAITHAQLLAQAKAGAAQWGIDKKSRIVSWMPHYHNFGLHFGFLVPLLSGASSVLFSPLRFIESPERWLHAIHRHRATHTAAPNFAFDLLCSNVDSMPGDISLRSLRTIVCGGEVVRKPTYDRFVQMFKQYGLNAKAFCPHYGLSETGAITTRRAKALRFIALESASLRLGKVKAMRNRAQSYGVIDCGEPRQDMEVRIVDPNARQLCIADAVGEIWVRAASVAHGYWNESSVTAEQFGATIVGQDHESYFRTGDLGFLRNKQLYIVGRRKELIIVHGKNHHPVDIELSIQKSLPQLTTQPIVFACEVDGKEQTVVMQAINSAQPMPDYVSMANTIVDAASSAHGLDLYDVCLLRDENIPRTRGGKIQKSECRNAYLSQSIPLLYSHKQATAISCVPTASREKSSNTLWRLQREVLFAELKTDAVFNAKNLGQLGLNSIQLVRLAKRIEEVFGVQFAPPLLFKYRDVESIANHIASQLHGVDQVDSATITPASAGDATPTAIKDIVIVGMSGHFPGADNLATFWTNLHSGRDSISSIESERPELLRIAREYGNGAAGFPPWGGFVSNVEAFDAGFFGISRTEAESMDPQQRKILELVWETIEASGHNPLIVARDRVAIFVGAHNCDYAELLGRQPHLANTYGAYLDSGLHMSMIANRVSRWFDFRGRSETINTACSSSLVALCHATQALLRSECEVAVVAGVNLLLSPRVFAASHQAGMLAADGRCKTFDQDANGFVRAEGYGAVMLKSRQRALLDNDTIYATIKSAVLNHDGYSNSLRAPNLESQKELIKSAYRQSGISPKTVTYIEVHGTGTALGDPIEIGALQEAFAELEPSLPIAYCGLGTVKTNIGHCESAAGIAGLIKTLLAMKHGELPASLHFTRLNPHISLNDSPFYIVREHQSWQRLQNTDGSQLPRRAGISSFGFGGANAHVIVEETIIESVGRSTNKFNSTHPALIVLSARNELRLLDQCKQMLIYLASTDGATADLADMSYTLQVGREAMNSRLAFTADSIGELRTKLTDFIEGKTGHGETDDLYRGDAKKNKNALSSLNADDDTGSLINLWIQKGKYSKLIDLWVKGLSIDWGQLYEEGSNYCAEHPKRIALPTYPFAKERYWVEGSRESKHLLRKTDTSKRLDNTRIEQLLESLIANELDEVTVIEQLRMTVAE